MRGKRRSCLRSACARIGEPDKVEEPCEAKLLAGLRVLEVRYQGNSGGCGCGGCCLVAAVGAGFLGGFWDRGGRGICGRMEDAELFSKDSPRLLPFSTRVPIHSRSMGNMRRALAPAGVAESLPPAEETETE